MSESRWKCCYTASSCYKPENLAAILSTVVSSVLGACQGSPCARYTKITNRWLKTGRVIRKPIGLAISANLWSLCKIMTGLGVNQWPFVPVCTCSRGVLKVFNIEMRRLSVLAGLLQFTYSNVHKAVQINPPFGSAASQQQLVSELARGQCVHQWDIWEQSLVAVVLNFIQWIICEWIPINYSFSTCRLKTINNKWIITF